MYPLNPLRSKPPRWSATEAGYVQSSPGFGLGAQGRAGTQNIMRKRASGIEAATLTSTSEVRIEPPARTTQHPGGPARMGQTRPVVEPENEMDLGAVFG